MKKRIYQLLEEKQYNQLRTYLNSMNAMDIVPFIEESQESLLILRLLSKEKAADVFAHVNKKTKTYLIDLFTSDEIKQLFDELYLDDTVDTLEELPANLVEKVLKNVDSKKREHINYLLQYPHDCAGALMTSEFVTLHSQTLVKESIQILRRKDTHIQNIYTCYVVDEKKLVGIISTKTLLLSDDDMCLKDIMNQNFISVQTHTSLKEVFTLFQKYNFLSLPVLDQERCFVGAITFDDIKDEYIEDTNEDIALMGAIEPHEESYFHTSVIQHARHRIVWLLILMFSATITGSIISRYEEAFQAIPLLVSFIPMLMDTGGNCGSQSSTLIIRGLATNEISFKDILKVIFKELRIAIVVGVILALANGLRIYVMYHNVLIAITIVLSLLITVILSKIIGCILPLLADRIGLDPAIMASPLITTIVDTCSILVYFNVAVQIFHLTL